MGNPEWWQAAVGVLLVTSGLLIWAIRLEQRLAVLERLLDRHISDERGQLGQMMVHLDRVEKKIDQLRLRCVAFHHRMAPDLLGDPE